MIKDAVIRLKLPDNKGDIVAIRADAMIEFLNNFVNGSIELIQTQSLRDSVLEIKQAHPDYLVGYNDAAVILRDTFVGFIDKVNAMNAMADITPGSISRLDPEKL